MFLDMKPAKEIVLKVIPRQLSYIVKQLDKIKIAQLNSFTKKYPGELPAMIKTYKKKMIDETLSHDDIKSLVKMVWYQLRKIKDDANENTEEDTKRMAFHLCKIIRVLEEIDFVATKIKSHQQDQSPVTHIIIKRV